MTRYLFGPVDAPFVRRHLHAEVASWRCLPFDHYGATGLTASPSDTWERFCARLPEWWRPSTWPGGGRGLWTRLRGAGN